MFEIFKFSNTSKFHINMSFFNMLPKGYTLMETKLGSWIQRLEKVQHTLGGDLPGSKTCFALFYKNN